MDEIEGQVGFLNPADRSELSWPAQAGATHYQVMRSNTTDFSSGCMMYPRTTDTFLSVADDPPQGGSCYLVRAQRPNLGSWGADSAPADRVLVCD